MLEHTKGMLPFMSIAGLVAIFVFILFFCYSLLINRIRQFQWLMFKIMIVVSIFVNVGYAILKVPKLGIISFNDLFQYFYIIVCFINVFVSSKIKISKKMFGSFIFLIVSLLLGLMFLIINPNNPEVIPMSVQMDNVYFGSEITSVAQFGNTNIVTLISVMMFSLSLFFSYKYISDKEKINELLTFIISSFHIFFIFGIIELLINNFISPTIFRETVYSIFGVADEAKTFITQARFGFYGFSALFTEQSYISVMFMYYIIRYISGFKSHKDVYFHIISMLILIANGTSTGLYLLPFAIYIYFKESLPSRFRNKNHILYFWLLTIICVGFGILLIFNNLDLVDEAITLSMDKLNSYLYGGQFNPGSNLASGAIRSYGNQIAYNAFESSPLFGVGIGTTRGYGIIPGFLANFGIIGALSYIYFIKHSFNIEIHRNNFILLLIIIAYFTIILSVWYIYYPALIPVYCAFSKYSTFAVRKSE